MDLPAHFAQSSVRQRINTSSDSNFLDKCEEGYCDPLTQCSTNTSYVFSCSDCPTGYVGTGETKCKNMSDFNCPPGYEISNDFTCQGKPRETFFYIN